MARRWPIVALGALLAAAPASAYLMLGGDGAVEQLLDHSDGSDWPAYGRSYGEQHYSPLAAISDRNIARLGLAWSLDLGQGNSTTAPIEVAGTLYFASGLSIVHAVDAASGRLLWTYDPDVPSHAGQKMRQGWGSRGIAYDKGRLFTGALDGRLIAVDAKTGKPLWSVMTVGKDDARYITGAPRIFDGKVIIGHAGADNGPVRGYVTAYDAATGRQLWRFHTVPGNPADGFENAAMAMAAKTWSGEWWKYGGGGTVWNAITYDAEQDLILLGTGNGAPWNHHVRSEGKGDNLFLCSIVALDAKTGEYRWHYQINPGESWDYNASMDMELADLTIGGKLRKVVMTAPKNGFFYVIDRVTGKLISAEPIAKVNWASRIDVESGRPVENPAARYPDGSTFLMWPSGVLGAHSWMPMAYSPQSGLVYIPKIEMAAAYDDKGVDRATWAFQPGMVIQSAANVDFAPPVEGSGRSELLAWDPVAQKKAWSVPTPGFGNGGVLATGGGLVFQGQIDGSFNAYAARTGKRLWSFAAQAPIAAPPISYRVGGVQYVTVLTGYGTSAAVFGGMLQSFDVDYRRQARRVLTFAIGGRKRLPQARVAPPEPVRDPDFRPDATLAAGGVGIFGAHCTACHGVNAIAKGNAPDLRMSTVPPSRDAFLAIVRDGALRPQGMPDFRELTEAQFEALRHYLRTRADDLRHDR